MWCGFIPLLTNKPETCCQKGSIKQTLRHTYYPTPEVATVLAVSKSSFQKSNVFTAAGDTSLPTACWVSCSLGSMSRGAEPVKGSDSLMSCLSRNSWRHSVVLRCMDAEPPQSCERHTLEFHDGLHPSEPKVTGFMAKQMDFAGRRRRPPEEG